MPQEFDASLKIQGTAISSVAPVDDYRLVYQLEDGSVQLANTHGGVPRGIGAFDAAVSSPLAAIRWEDEHKARVSLCL